MIDYIIAYAILAGIASFTAWLAFREDKVLVSFRDAVGSAIDACPTCDNLKDIEFPYCGECENKVRRVEA